MNVIYNCDGRRPSPDVRHRDMPFGSLPLNDGYKVRPIRAVISISLIYPLHWLVYSVPNDDNPKLFLSARSPNWPLVRIYSTIAPELYVT